MATCDSPVCRATIEWIRLQPSGKRHPIDPDPCDEGNILLTGTEAMAHGTRPVGVIVSKAAREQHKGELYRSHFATCPAAQAFRQLRQRR